MQAHIRERNSPRLVELFEAIDERSALDGNAAVVVDDSRIRLNGVGGHVKFYADDVAGFPPAPQRKILAGRDSRNGLTVNCYLRVFRPSGNAQVEREFTWFLRCDGDVSSVLPRITRLLLHFQRRSVLEMPIKNRIVIKMQIKAVSAGAVEIARQRSKRALEVRWATGRVVPRVADLVAI